jgi:hypothetical protein
MNSRNCIYFKTANWFIDYFETIDEEVTKLGTEQMNKWKDGQMKRSRGFADQKSKKNHFNNLLIRMNEIPIFYEYMNVWTHEKINLDRVRTGEDTTQPFSKQPPLSRCSQIFQTFMLNYPSIGVYLERIQIHWQENMLICDALVMSDIRTKYFKSFFNEIRKNSNLHSMKCHSLEKSRTLLLKNNENWLISKYMYRA